MNSFLTTSAVAASLLLLGAGCAQTKISITPSSTTSTDVQEQTSPAMINDADETMEQTTTTDAMMEKKTEATGTEMMKKEEPTATSSAMMKKEEPKKAEVMVRAGSYVAYDASKINLAADGKVILFFHAGWCPTCRTADQNITTSLNAIPNNVTILKTDYDSSTELRRKYGITYQHTFVQVDAQGNQLKKWSGSSSLADIVANIQ